ncbi:prenyltransferase/squalene oxidase repeat-containing protein [Tautonia sociabilis]|uniref:Prenyltransferase n=1 Tax=Tautonia sociabilis TaxID=2080755 RepID=A0A432MNR4_9BACT|nr:prenyltransferase/squalene oxidase repeat-containing protein [Tautonia sociabilis]RUL88718.1 prenyltransferase [Tautonia sociabilis]
MIRSPAAATLLGLALLIGPAPAATGQDLPGPPPRRVSNAETDAAARRALDFLARSQHADGSWESGGFGKATSVTSLAVMSFLACGHVPGEPGPYREVIERGISYVLNHQRPDGMLVSNTSHGPMYCHGISTLMLAEVVGMCPDPALASRCRSALAAAVALIVRAQRVPKSDDHAGGWRYQPGSYDSDLSVSGWQVVALRAARDAGCSVPSEAIDDAVDYVRRCVEPRSGGFSYQAGRGGPNSPRTGTGILSLELCGEHGTPEAIAGAEYLREHPPNWGSDYFFYEAYYCPQALFQLGDAYFVPYYTRLVPILLDRQEADGSWYSPSGNDRTGGRNYCTAMGVLALAVEYRYLPIYQR